MTGVVTANRASNSGCQGAAQRRVVVALVKIEV